MKTFTYFAIATALMCSPQAIADDGMLNTIVVTGTRIDAEDLRRTPNVTMRVSADFVLFEVGFVNASLDRSERNADLEKAFDAVAAAANRNERISIAVGDVEESSPMETTTYEESVYDNGSRASLSLVVKAYTKEDDTFEKVRTRVEAFIEGVPEYGRTQSYTDDEQYLGITDLDRYRPALIGEIAKEVDTLTQMFKASEISVNGLEEQTVTQTVGPMALEIFIPYTITLTSNRD